MISTSAFAAGTSTQASTTKGQKSSIERNFKSFGGGRGIKEGMNKGGFKGKDFGQAKINPFDSLVTAGTITQTQADAIMKAMDAARGSNKTIKETLDSLVTAGTITQAQEDAIVKVLPQNEGRLEGHVKMNPFDSLATAGTITQSQADAIMKAMDAARGSNKTIKETLDSLVTAGTITQAQEDAVLKLLPPMRR